MDIELKNFCFQKRTRKLNAKLRHLGIPSIKIYGNEKLSSSYCLHSGLPKNVYFITWELEMIPSPKSCFGWGTVSIHNKMEEKGVGWGDKPYSGKIAWLLSLGICIFHLQFPGNISRVVWLALMDVSDMGYDSGGSIWCIELVITWLSKHYNKTTNQTSILIGSFVQVDTGTALLILTKWFILLHGQVHIPFIKWDRITVFLLLVSTISRKS